EKYKRIHKFIFKYLTAYGFPIAIGMWMLAQPIIELVYNKPGYEPASQALQIFGIFIFFRFLGNVSGQSLTAIDKQNQENIIAGSYFIILLIANFFMINAYGFMGAVYTTVVCEALLRLTYIIFDFKYLKLNIFSYFKKLAPIALACALMAVFIYFTKGSLNVIIVVVLSALFYGFLLWLFRFFDAYDKTLFSQLINKKKD
ncbi:MAG: polysaccharide biosynthesis C-terminal domain-containing protein, partial [Patescibacteria group bacterium]